jgi:hypothetical protein
MSRSRDVELNGAKMQITMPAMLRATQPDMKLIVIMRDPVARLYSAFWYYGCMYGIYGKWGMTREGFHEFATEQIAIVDSCINDGKSMRQCARELFNPAQQVVKGMYAAFVPDWLAEYPSEQILWIRAEDYYAQEEHYLKVSAPPMSRAVQRSKARIGATSIMGALNSRMMCRRL